MASTETITYSFVQFYYQKLHDDPTQLYQIYTTNAKLTHSKVPANVDQITISNKSLETQVFSNKKEIEGFYSNSTHFANSKIRVSSIDSQAVFEDSILINVIGELALTDESPVYRFTQSFILTPGNVAKSYVITNDIFRLIPDDYFELSQEDSEEIAEEPTAKSEGEKVKGEAVASTEEKAGQEEKASKEEQTPVAQPTETADVTAEQNGKVEAEQEATKEGETKAEEVVAEKLEAEVVADTKEEVKAAGSSEGDGKAAAEKQQPAKPEEPKKAMSWAQVSLSATAKPVVEKPKAPTKTPKTAKPAPSSPSVTAVSNSPSQSQSPAQSNKPKRYVNSVLVNKIDDLKAHDLKTALEKAFGKTTKVEPRGHFGLVDFETKEGQQKALSKGFLKILNSTVTIEVKTEKLEFNDKAKKTPTTNNRQNNRQPNTKQHTNGSVNQRRKTNAK